MDDNDLHIQPEVQKEDEVPVYLLPEKTVHLYQSGFSKNLYSCRLPMKPDELSQEAPICRNVY